MFGVGEVFPNDINGLDSGGEEKLIDHVFFVKSLPLGRFQLLWNGLAVENDKRLPRIIGVFEAENLAFYFVNFFGNVFYFFQFFWCPDSHDFELLDFGDQADHQVVQLIGVLHARHFDDILLRNLPPLAFFIQELQSIVAINDLLLNFLDRTGLQVTCVDRVLGHVRRHFVVLLVLLNQEDDEPVLEPEDDDQRHEQHDIDPRKGEGGVRVNRGVEPGQLGQILGAKGKHALANRRVGDQEGHRVEEEQNDEDADEEEEDLEVLLHAQGNPADVLKGGVSKGKGLDVRRQEAARAGVLFELFLVHFLEVAELGRLSVCETVLFSGGETVGVELLFEEEGKETPLVIEGAGSVCLV